jgi:hypothetical protein
VYAEPFWVNGFARQLTVVAVSALALVVVFVLEAALQLESPMKAACASWTWPGSRGRPCPHSLWPSPLPAYWLASVPHKLQRARELSRSAQRDLQLHRSDVQYYPEGVYDGT